MDQVSLSSQPPVPARLSRVDLRTLVELFNALMLEEKVFRDENLSARGLAARLGISRHQLSELIAYVHGTNFYGLMNEARVREGCRLLLEEPERSILSIAFEAGFAAKSTFNAEFRRRVGCTPRQYRRSRLKSESSAA